MDIGNVIIYLIIFLATITKRAQMLFPAAPILVSSLVHSSTLVTSLFNYSF